MSKLLFFSKSCQQFIIFKLESKVWIKKVDISKLIALVAGLTSQVIYEIQQLCKHFMKNISQNLYSLSTWQLPTGMHLRSASEVLLMSTLFAGPSLIFWVQKFGYPFRWWLLLFFTWPDDPFLVIGRFCDQSQVWKYQWFFSPIISVINA